MPAESSHPGSNAGYTWVLMDAPPRFPFISLIAPRLWLPVILAALAFAPAAMAGDHADNPRRAEDLTPAEVREPEEPEKPWQEEQILLPPFPRAQDLIPLRADVGGSGYIYYVDVNSVSLDADEVLRYTVIIQSPRGASNIVYEGIRCATKEIKTFAYGTRDGRFEPMADPRWMFVFTKGPLGYRTSMVERYVCDENGWAIDTDAVLERLVTHDPRRARIAPKNEPGLRRFRHRSIDGPGAGA